MAFLSIRELSYQRRKLREVRHVTLDPGGPGVVRVHLVPPRRVLDKDVPCVLIVNGQDILPVRFSWAVLLSEFIDSLQAREGREIQAGEWDSLVAATVAGVRLVYPRVAEATVRADLLTIIGTLTDLAAGRQPTVEIGLLSLGDYAAYMAAPHRMDLMISAMEKNGVWNCNQQCLHCYAAGQPNAARDELSTDGWLEIIKRCRRAGIPQLTFTGGEPTMRGDLVELVEAARWFVTRLNTNGVCLSEDLCRRLSDASLDSVQITLYSADPAIHNQLVGADNHSLTVAGIRNALAAGLNVSVNTPLCSLNTDYPSTIAFLADIGIRYLSCSGLIPAGQATGAASAGTRLDAGSLTAVLTDAMAVCRQNNLEIAFTSPGWLPENTLRAIGFTSIPTCGACLSNMAVAPDGQVVPCQSWLSGPALGNLLHDPWPRIWQHRTCREIRQKSARLEQLCQLSELKSSEQGGNASC